MFGFYKSLVKKKVTGEQLAVFYFDSAHSKPI